MYLIIGQGAAGASAALELRRLNQTAPIILLSAEDCGFYSRIDLPEIVAGKYRPQEALLRTTAQFQAQGIACIAGQRAVRLWPQERSVELACGRLRRLPAMPWSSARG